MKEAELAEKRGDFVSAEKSYESALVLAEESNWQSGVVTAKQNLAAMSVLKKDYVRAETLLKEAKGQCRADHACAGLDTLYDDLIFLYLFELKDIVKVEAIIDEVIAERAVLSSRVDIPNKLKKYSSEMRTAGFEKAADRLDDILRSN